MMGWLLGEISRNPDRVFTRSELLKRFPKVFPSLVDQGVFIPLRIDPERFVIHHPSHGRLEGMTVGGTRYAMDPDEEEAEPVALRSEDVTRYQLNVEMLLKRLAEANDIVFRWAPSNNGMYFFGESRLGQHSCGFAFVSRFRKGDFYVRLSGLKTVCGPVDGLIVLMTSQSPQGFDVTNALLKEKILVVDLRQVLDETNLCMALEEPEARLFPGKVRLTSQQARDYDTHHFRCYDRLTLCGKQGPGRNYYIEVNGTEIPMAYNELLFLLYFISELKAGRGGWVHYQRLIDDEVARDQGHVQRAMGDIRKRIGGYLSDEGRLNLIENDRKGHYRLSTHPDFIRLPDTQEWERLYQAVRDAVDEERQGRE